MTRHDEPAEGDVAGVAEVLDFPTAWEIARRVEPEYHHNKCSFNVTNGALLCDCKVLTDSREYRATERAQ